MSQTSSDRWPGLDDEPAIGSDPFEPPPGALPGVTPADATGTWGDPDLEPAPVSAFWETSPNRRAPSPRLERRPARPVAPRPAPPAHGNGAAPSPPSRAAAPPAARGSRPGPELERERAARVEAERSAERLAAAVAKEHKLRVHAERQAEQALRELELVNAHGYVTRGAPAPRSRGGHWWRRLLNWLQA